MKPTGIGLARQGREEKDAIAGVDEVIALVRDANTHLRTDDIALALAGRFNRDPVAWIGLRWAAMHEGGSDSK